MPGSAEIESRVGFSSRDRDGAGRRGLDLAEDSVRLLAGWGWLGYLEEYPDYWTQGETLGDLLEHLKDLYLDLNGCQIPGARRVGEWVL